MQHWNNSTGKKLIGWLLALIAVLAPAFAMAAGGEANIKLEFSQQDKILLGISLGFGILALLFAAGIWNWVKSQSPGNEKMQEVGGAIRDGALAYLKQQFRTMGIFVVIIAVGLPSALQSVSSSVCLPVT
jgi:K(+)-stimulated pyrophosphate-energized sodium pump